MSKAGKSGRNPIRNAPAPRQSAVRCPTRTLERGCARRYLRGSSCAFCVVVCCVVVANLCRNGRLLRTFFFGLWHTADFVCPPPKNLSLQWVSNDNKKSGRSTTFTHVLARRRTNGVPPLPHANANARTHAGHTRTKARTWVGTSRRALGRERGAGVGRVRVPCPSVRSSSGFSLSEKAGDVLVLGCASRAPS